MEPGTPQQHLCLTSLGSACLWKDLGELYALENRAMDEAVPASVRILWTPWSSAVPASGPSWKAI